MHMQLAVIHYRTHLVINLMMKNGHFIITISILPDKNFDTLMVMVLRII